MGRDKGKTPPKTQTKESDQRLTNTHRYVASASKHGQSRKSTTKEKTAPDSKSPTSTGESSLKWWWRKD